MTEEEFRSSLAQTTPPDNLNPFLNALWFDSNGDWISAHESIQDISGKEAAWIHAYLHRKEGDLSNARYWYDRAGKALPAGTLEEERESILKHFIT